MHRLIATALLSTASVLSACGAAEPEPAPVNETALYSRPDTEIETAPAPAAPDTSPESAKANVPTNGIRRTDLDRVLALGPGGMLAMVETEPVRANGRFQGFRILRFVHGPPSVVDLKTGDVLRGVNGRPVASPDDFFAVYQALQTASELRIELIRHGSPLTAAYPIVE